MLWQADIPACETGPQDATSMFAIAFIRGSFRRGYLRRLLVHGEQKTLKCGLVK